MVEWTNPFTIGITSGEYLPTPIIPVGIHSQTIGIIIPQSTLWFIIQYFKELRIFLFIQ